MAIQWTTNEKPQPAIMHLHDGLMIKLPNGNYALTAKGLFVSDRVIGELFVV